MTEDELYWRVTTGNKRQPGLCRQLGVLWYHPYDSRRSVHGWPDLVLVGSHGVAFRELKSNSGVLSEAQREWGRRLLAAGADWGIWRPRDLAYGTIRAELARLMGV